MTEEDEALWFKGCSHLFWVPQPGRLATPAQMDEEQRTTGLPAGKPVPKVRWCGKASSEMSEPANICILFAFGGIT